MSEAVDTRIVEAKFDSEQFEKGVDRTVKKLDELKKSLNMDESGKSIAQMTESASSALEKLENRFTSFLGMVKNKIISGFADEITGAIFKVKNSITGFIHSLSSGQISPGIAKYEQMLTSVRTMISAGETEESAYEAIETLGSYADQTSYSLDQMTSALSKMRSAGVSLDDGVKAVEGISNACAAAGINATDASRAFYNLAQAYSSGSLKYTDYKSLELLNMTTEKFKENMLVAAEEAGTLKKLSDGVYQTINANDKKVTNGKKVTIQNINDALKYGFMNKEAMNKLFGGQYFFDEEKLQAIREEFGLDSRKSEDRSKALEIAKERYGELAVSAYMAAREARSFTDVMSTLKDVVSRGWAKTFELIFGKLGEATEFFTWLTESNLANFIYSIGEFRNGVLTAWSESGGRDDLMEGLKNIDELIGDILSKLGLFVSEDDMEEKSAQLGYRLSEASRNFKEFTERLEDFFNDERVNRIKRIFDTIGHLLSTVFTAVGIAFRFLKSAFLLLEPVLGSVIDNIDKVLVKINAVFNAKPEDGAANGLSAIDTALTNILKVIQPLIKPLQDVINILGDIGAFVAEMAVSTFVSNIEMFADALGFVIELFGGSSAQKDNAIVEEAAELEKQFRQGKLTLGEYLHAIQQLPGKLGILASLKNTIYAIGTAFSDAAKFMSGFFKTLYDDIRLMLGLREPMEGEEGGFFANVRNYFNASDFVKNVKDIITKAIADIKTFIAEIPTKIGNIWNTIDEFLFGKKVNNLTLHNGEATATGTIGRLRTGFSKWLYEAVEDVKNWITTELPNRVKALWNSIDEFFFGKKVKNINLKNGKATATGTTGRLRVGFSKWLNQAITDIKNWVTTELPNQIKALWNTIDEFFFGRKVKVQNKDHSNPNDTVRVKEGFSAWLEQAVQDVKDWITSAPQKIADLWNWVIDFIFYRAPNEGEINPETNQEYGPTDRVKNSVLVWLEALPGKVWKWISTDAPALVGKIWGKLLDFIFGPKVTAQQLANHEIDPTTGLEYKPNDRVKTGFYNWLIKLPNAISEWFKNDFPEAVKSIWNTVLDFILGRHAEPGEINPDTNETYGPNMRVKEGFSLWLDGAIKDIEQWVKTIPDKISDLWHAVLDFLFGKEVDPKKINPETGEEYGPNVRVKDGFSLWLANVVDTIKNWLKSVPEKISDIWDTVLGAIFGNTSGKKFKSVKFDQSFYDQLVKDDPTGYAADQYKEFVDRNTNPIIKTVEDTVNALGIDIGQVISNLPSYILKGVNFGVDIFKTLFNNITEWLSRINDNNGLTDGVAEQIEASGKETSPVFKALMEFGANLKTAFTETIPAFITEAFEWIGKKASGIWDGLKSAFTGEDAEDGIAEAVSGLGTKIREGIERLPSTIRTALDWVKNLLTRKKKVEISPEELLDFSSRKPWVKSTNPFGNNSGLKDLKKGFDSLSGDLKKEITDDSYNFFEDYVEDPFNFREWISQMGQSISDIISELGPYVLEGIQKVFEWIGQGLTWITDVFNDKGEDEDVGHAIMRHIGADGENGQKFAGLTDGLTKVGETIKNLITNIIPEFIKSGIKVLSEEAPKIFSNGLSGIFGSDGDIEDSIKEAGEAMTRDMFGEMGGNALAVSKAENNGDRIKRETLIKQLEEEAKTLENEGKSATAEYTVIKNRIDKLQKMDSDYVKIIVDRRKRIEELTKLEKEYKEKRDKLPEYVEDTKIFDLYSGYTTHGHERMRNPDWIRADADWMAAANELTYLSRIEGDEIAYVDADSWEELGESTTNILDIFDTLAKFGTSKTMATIGVIASLAWLISSLKNLFTQGDELKAEANKAKWTAITVAISGISVIMGYITYLASKEDQTAITNVMDMFDRLTGFAERIGNLVLEFTKVKTVGTAINTLFEGFGKYLNGADASSSFAEKVGGGVLKKVAGIAGTSAGIEMLGSAVTDTFGMLVEAFTEVGTVLDEFISPLIDVINKMVTVKDKVSDAIDVMVQMFTMIHVLCYGVGLTEIPVSEDSGIPSVTTEMLDASKANFSLVDEFEDRVAFISSISMLVNSLAESLKTFEEVQSPTEQIQKMLETVTGEGNNFGELIKQLFTVIFQNLFDPEAGFMYAEGVGRVDYQSAVAGFQILGEALNIFGKGFEGLNTENVAAMKDAIGVLAEIATVIYEEAPGKQAAFSKLFSGDKSLSAFSSEVKKFGIRMKGFFENVKDIPGTDDSEYKKTKNAVELVAQISKDMVEVFGNINSLSLDKISLNAAVAAFNSDDFMTFISNVGAMFSVINTQIGESVPNARIEAIASSVRAVSNIIEAAVPTNGTIYLSQVEGLIKLFNGDDFIKLITGIGKMTSEINKNIGEDVSTDRIASIASGIESVGNIIATVAAHPMSSTWLDNLERFFQILNNDEAAQFRDTANIMTSLLTAMNETDLGDEDFTSPKITPVLEITDEFVAKANQIRSMFGVSAIEVKDGQFVPPENSTSDFLSNLDLPMPINYSNDLEQIKARLENIEYSTNTFNNSLRNAKFVMYGKDFAYSVGPDIDEWLGMEGVYVARNNGTG